MVDPRATAHARGYLSDLVNTDPTTLTSGSDRAAELLPLYMDVVQKEPSWSSPRRLWETVATQMNSTTLSRDTVVDANTAGRPSMTHGPQNHWTHFYAHGSIFMFKALQDDTAYSMIKMHLSRPEIADPIASQVALSAWRATWLMFAPVWSKISQEPSFAEATVAESAALSQRVPVWRDVLTAQATTLDQHFATFLSAPQPPASTWDVTPVDPDHPYPICYTDTRPGHEMTECGGASGWEVLALIAMFGIPVLAKKC